MTNCIVWRATQSEDAKVIIQYTEIPTPGDCKNKIMIHDMGPRDHGDLGDTISDSILEGHKTPFVTNSLHF